MELLVTGASRALGRRVADLATERGHVVRRADDGTGELGDAEAVIHCASPKGRVADSRRLAVAAARSGAHLVVPGVVGADVIPLRRHRDHARAEDEIVASGCRHTIRRFTEFHDQVWGLLEVLTRSPVAFVPHDTRFQVLDPATAARELVEAAESDPRGRLPDLGGPTVYDARELARSVAAALGRKRRVVGVSVPGLAGAAYRAGFNLAEERDRTGGSWNDFVAARIGG